MARQFSIMDGNQATATIAYKTNEVISIYPVTSALPMGEWADQKKKNPLQHDSRIRFGISLRWRPKESKKFGRFFLNPHKFDN